jgi:hypothetical protein
MCKTITGADISTFIIMLLQAVFRQGNNAEKKNRASEEEEREREALMQCFVYWVSRTYQPNGYYMIRVC